MLKNGSTGDDVKRLQEKLGLKADGSFGSVTETKVKEWQTSVGLKSDGVIGDVSWEKLFGKSVVVESTKFKLDKLVGHLPKEVIQQIPDTAQKFNITNPLRLAHFLSQCAHESGNFKAVTENLNYSADGLKKVFPRLFPLESSQDYAKNPERIGARVYANRMGNGDEASKEGYKFRGRGYIQLTGKSNYDSFSKFIGEDCVGNPELVATKYPLASAAFFFDSNKLWSICDKGADSDTVLAVTKRVNGGTNGLEDRLKHFKEFYSLLTK